jgi:hypothetical protein
VPCCALVGPLTLNDSDPPMVEELEDEEEDELLHVILVVILVWLTPSVRALYRISVLHGALDWIVPATVNVRDSRAGRIPTTQRMACSPLLESDPSRKQPGGSSRIDTSVGTEWMTFCTAPAVEALFRIVAV